MIPLQVSHEFSSVLDANNIYIFMWQNTTISWCLLQVFSVCNTISPRDALGHQTTASFECIILLFLLSFPHKCGHAPLKSCNYTQINCFNSVNLLEYHYTFLAVTDWQNIIFARTQFSHLTCVFSQFWMLCSRYLFAMWLSRTSLTYSSIHNNTEHNISSHHKRITKHGSAFSGECLLPLQ